MNTISNNQKKILNFLLLLSFQMGYLSWGHGGSMFIFQGEVLLFTKAIKDPLSLIHPFILIPFLGQLLLVYTLFQQEPRRAFTLLGLGSMGILMLMLLFIGVLKLDYIITGCALPFFIMAFFIVRYNRKPKNV